MSSTPPSVRTTDRPFSREEGDGSLDRVWRPAREVTLEDAPPGAPKHLLHVRFPDASALSRSCIYGEPVGGLHVSAKKAALGDLVELVVTLDAGPVRLWCARGRVVRRRMRRDEADLDIELLPDEVDAWNRLDSIVLGFACEKLDRLDERVPARLTTSVRVPGETAKRLVSIDLSRSGVGIESREPLPVGTAVDLELKTGFFARPVHVRGLVCWQKAERGFGVKFLFDTELQRKELELLLQRQR